MTADHRQGKVTAFIKYLLCLVDGKVLMTAKCMLIIQQYATVQSVQRYS